MTDSNLAGARSGLPICSKLMVIRHAERPDENGSVAGVAENGRSDPTELTVRGWQRAGALVRLFRPLDPAALRPSLAEPGAIFATAPTSEHPSQRPLHTVKALADDLHLEVQTGFAIHQEADLVKAALDADATVLICWHHERIVKIAEVLNVQVGSWPDEVFDRILVFDRKVNGWSLQVLGQRLLPGDA